MKSLQQEEIGAALDAVDAGYARLRTACSDSVGNAFRVDLAERLERQHRINRGLMYRVFGELIEPPDGPDDPDLPAGTVISKLLWQRLASQALTSNTASLSPPASGRAGRSPALNCRPNCPGWLLPSRTATLTRPHLRGLQGRRRTSLCPSSQEGHRRAHHGAPRQGTRRELCPKLARDIAAELNPDTVFDEQDRRRRSGMTLGKQRADGLSYLRGWVDPEARAYIEASNAAVRPGRHQPETPIAETGDQLEMPTDAVTDTDTTDVESADTDSGELDAQDVAAADGEHVEVQPDCRRPRNGFMTP